MVNKTRGEVSVKVGSVEYKLRPSYDAIEMIEDLLGKGMIEVLQDLRASRLSYKALSAIVYAGAMATGDQKVPSRRDIGQAMVDEGMLPWIKKDSHHPIIKFCLMAVAGLEPDPEKKEVPSADPA